MLRKDRIVRLIWTNTEIWVYQQLQGTPKEWPGSQGRRRFRSCQR
jgi:hypothetical protein